MNLFEKNNIFNKLDIFKIKQKIVFSNSKKIANYYQHNAIKCQQINKIPEKILDIYKKNYQNCKILFINLST